MKADPAYEWTERDLAKLEKRITKEYRQAAEELQEKLDDYFRRYESKDKKWQRWVANGYKTQKQYDEWKMGQLAVGRRWEQMRANAASDLTNANKIARSIINKKLPGVYAENHDYAVYEVEHGLGVDISYTLYDHRTVERLFGDENIIPGAGDLNVAKDLAWNNEQVQSAMIQSIVQGESLPKMATRIAAVTAESNRKAAIRTARTLYTGVQNAGRVDSYRMAEGMGIELEKMWVATLDGRTRHSHREMDGETQKVEDVFSNDLMYPGDPDGEAKEIANCRCTLIAQLKGFEIDTVSQRMRYAEDIEGQSYEEWKHDKASRSNPIDLPEKVSAKIRQRYINEYRYGGNW